MDDHTMALTIQYLFIGWGFAECALAIARRATAGAVRREDRNTLPLLFGLIGLGIVLAFVLQPKHLAPLPLMQGTRLSLALALMVGGLVLRLTAIATLAELFTMDVAIQPGHALVTRGIYRFIRHPAYAGALVAFLGYGIALGDWLALAAIFWLPAAAIALRVRVEERVLAESFGARWQEYAARTKRLLPGVY